jgi:opacity protein-like surface antigen
MMTRSLVAVAVVSMTLSSAAADAGQEKIPYLQKPAPTDSTSTFSGCVTRGAAAGTHTLTNVTRDGDVAKDSLQGKAVVLSGTDVDFSNHVGHRVSVTGSFVSQPPATGTTGTNPTAPANTKDSDVKTTGTLTVKSLIMLSDSCSTAGHQIH